MSFPEPENGLVIRYSYLWRKDALRGQEEGVKDRPCAIVLVTALNDGDRRVHVLPITHSMPQNPDDAVEIPLQTKARLGLDSERSWIVLTELNVFLWPGPDLRPVAGQGAHSVAIGFLPPRFFRHVVERFVLRVRNRRVAPVKRS